MPDLNAAQALALLGKLRQAAPPMFLRRPMTC